MVTMASSATGNVTTTPLSPDVSTTTVQKKSSENRRSNKPIMEKRRRARINHSLNELKTLILDAMKKDPARHSKLEKADILEMTVKHLETLHKQQAALTNVTDKYRAGFSECANEVTRFPGLDKMVRERLLQHLKNCLNSTAIAASGVQSNGCSGGTDLSLSGGGGGGNSRLGEQNNLQVHILPSSETNAIINSHNGIYLSAGANNGGVQLVPTRLPNGDIALILPSSSANGIQQRLAVSPSPSSTSTSSSPPPLAMINHNHHHHQHHHLQHSRSASTDSAASSNSSSIPLDRLSVNIPASSLSVDEMCHSPNSVHSNYSSSPRSPMSGTNVYDSYGMEYNSPDSQKPLSLVVREGYVDGNDEKPWRPW